jgi:hypothetical protein
VLEVLAPGLRLQQRLLLQLLHVLLLLLQKRLPLKLLLQLIVMTEIAHEFLQILDLVAKSMSLCKQKSKLQSVPEHWVVAHSCTDLSLIPPSPHHAPLPTLPTHTLLF